MDHGRDSDSNSDQSGFDFGSNWRAFSEARMTPQSLELARESLASLVGAERIRNARFLDVGCGSGLFSLAAAVLDAREVLGFDLSAEAVAVSRDNLARLLPEQTDSGVVRFAQGSILDPAFTATLPRSDVVYAWGSLHHTGAMWRAVDAAAQCTAPGGILVLALYNRHWTSPLWKIIKNLYNALSGPGRRAMEWALTPPMFLGAWITTGRFPMTRDRGMDFRYDLVDWIGGTPYEYASPDEVTVHLEKLGLQRQTLRPQQGFTGCAEYVFHRPGQA